jgi:hypothetical protein
VKDYKTYHRINVCNTAAEILRGKEYINKKKEAQFYGRYETITRSGNKYFYFNITLQTRKK